MNAAAPTVEQKKFNVVLDEFDKQLTYYNELLIKINNFTDRLINPGPAKTEPDDKANTPECIYEKTQYLVERLRQCNDELSQKINNLCDII